MKQLFAALFAAIIFLGCTTRETPTPKFATVHFYFAPDTEFGAGTAVFEIGNAKWTIEKAHVVFGEIGIHWDATWAPEQRSFEDERSPRHDVPGGRPAPVIYDFFAIDLLQEQHIQQLTVEEGAFDHIHKAAQNTDALSQLGKRVVGIERFQETLGEGYTFYFSGKVSDGANERNFVLRSRTPFQENDLEDIFFDQVVRDGEVWEFRLTPRLRHWFAGINIAELQANGNNITIDGVSGASNLNQLTSFINRFAGNNSLTLVRIKR